MTRIIVELNCRKSLLRLSAHSSALIFSPSAISKGVSGSHSRRREILIVLRVDGRPARRAAAR